MTGPIVSGTPAELEERVRRVFPEMPTRTTGWTRRGAVAYGILRELEADGALKELVRLAEIGVRAEVIAA